MAIKHRRRKWLLPLSPARYGNRPRALKQPKLSRTEHPRVEQMKKFQRQIMKGERVNRSLVSASAENREREIAANRADSQVRSEEGERDVSVKKRGERGSRIAIRSTSALQQEFGVFVRRGDYCFRGVREKIRRERKDIKRRRNERGRRRRRKKRGGEIRA